MPILSIYYIFKIWAYGPHICFPYGAYMPHQMPHNYAHIFDVHNMPIYMVHIYGHIMGIYAPNVHIWGIYAHIWGIYAHIWAYMHHICPQCPVPTLPTSYMTVQLYSVLRPNICAVRTFSCLACWCVGVVWLLFGLAFFPFFILFPFVLFLCCLSHFYFVCLF